MFDPNRTYETNMESSMPQPRLTKERVFAMLTNGDFDFGFKNFSGLNMDLSNRNIDKSNFYRAKLFGLILSNSSFIDAQFGDSEFNSTKCDNVNFSEAMFNGAAFIGTYLKNTKFHHCSMWHAKFHSVYAEGAEFDRATLGDASFAGKSNLEGARFRHSKCCGANFSKAILRNVEFNDADLTGANFSHADLRGATFLRAKLDLADFRGARLDNDTYIPSDISRNEALDFLTKFLNNKQKISTKLPPKKPGFRSGGGHSSARRY